MQNFVHPLVCIASAILKDVLLKSMMTEVQLRSLVSPAMAELVIKVGRLDDLCQVGTSICATRKFLPHIRPISCMTASLSESVMP